MNILFVLYHDFTANSASHVACFANELKELGHDCCIAVPNNKESVSRLGPTTFQSLDFSEVRALPSLFANGKGPDLLHAWTPREIVRAFSEPVMKEFGSRLFVHLEDNEWHILSCSLNRSAKALFSLAGDELDSLIEPGLSHPHRATNFMGMADGVTVIIDRLVELSPAGIPTIELWPSADSRLFFPSPVSKTERAALGIAKNSTVLAYAGNVHAANAHEIRSLYLAVAMLNRENIPTTLVRAGRDFYPFLGPGEEWALKHVVNLGLLPHTEIRSMLALADILIQPGNPDDFNDYRFPSKLPEFLSIGRPVVLPNTNIAKYMTHRKHAYLLDGPSAVTIADSVREIVSDGHLYQDLCAGAIEFSAQRLSWRSSARKLSDFYLENMVSSLQHSTGASI